MQHVQYSGLNIEDADELSLEDMMEGNCEELQDEEVDIGLSDNGKELKKRVATKTKNKSTLNEGREVTKKESEKWKPQSILTKWGRTDDVVTIGNGDQYYYFKIPHKAR